MQYDFFFFDCDSLHARLNNHYEAWSYKKKKYKKIRAQLEPRKSTERAQLEHRKNLQLKDIC